MTPINYPTKLLLALIFTLSSVRLLFDIPLGLYPSFSRAFRTPWTLLTAGLYFGDAMTLLISLPSLLFFASGLSPSEGFLETIESLLVSTVPANYAFLVYYSVKNFMLSYTYHDGQAVPATAPMALLGGLSVALMQGNPDCTFLFTPNVPIPASKLPALQILCAIFVSLACQSFAPLILCCSGVMSVYLHLRFVKWQDGLRGDRSIKMLFSNMFPSPLRPLAAVLAGRAFSLMLKLDRWQLFEDWRVDDEEERYLGRRTSAQEIERRKTLALSLLDQKMAVKHASSHSQALRPSQKSTALAIDENYRPMELQDIPGMNRPIMSLQA